MADTKRVLTDKQKLFLDALAGEAKGNIRKAMNVAGYSKATSQQEIYNSLSAEIVDVAQKFLASQSIAAVFGMVDILDNPHKVGASNQINAAKEILDRAGIVKKEQLEVKTDGGGIFILPPKRREEDN